MMNAGLWNMGARGQDKPRRDRAQRHLHWNGKGQPHPSLPPSLHHTVCMYVCVYVCRQLLRLSMNWTCLDHAEAPLLSYTSWEMRLPSATYVHLSNTNITSPCHVA